MIRAIWANSSRYYTAYLHIAERESQHFFFQYLHISEQSQVTILFSVYPNNDFSFNLQFIKHLLKSKQFFARFINKDDFFTILTLGGKSLTGHTSVEVSSSFPLGSSSAARPFCREGYAIITAGRITDITTLIPSPAAAYSPLGGGFINWACSLTGSVWNLSKRCF